ncbi:hypothetical protein VR46_31305, partial [Streptomyces sp. NRRL S-444]
MAADAERVQKLVCAHLLSDDCDPLVSVLTGLRLAEAAQLMDAVGPALTKDLQAAFETHDAWKATQAAPAAGAAASDVGEEEPPLPDIALEALEAILEHWSDTSPRAAHAIARLLLHLDRQTGREAVERHLELFPQVRDTALARVILSSMSRRPLSTWPMWLGVLDPCLDLQNVDGQVTLLLAKLWSEASESTTPPASDTVGEVADGFIRLFGDRAADQHPDI